MGYRIKLTTSLVALAVGAGSWTPSEASTLSTLGINLTSNYLVIDLADSESDKPELDPDGSDSSNPGSVKQSTYGRVHREADGNNNGSVSAPGGSPTSIDKPNTGQLLPGPNDPSVASFGGNIAILDDEVVDVDMTNITIYTDKVGPGSGINCIANCVDNGPVDSELRTPTPGETLPEFGDNNTFDTGIGQSEGDLELNNGVYINQDGGPGEVDLNLVNDEVFDVKDNIAGLSATATIFLDELFGESFGVLGDDGDGDDAVLLSELLALTSSTGSIQAGLNVIDIFTGNGSTQNENDFLVSNMNWIIDGDLTTDFIFRVVDTDNFNINNSRILVGDQMDLNSTLFYVRDDNDGATINFTDAETNGIAFWNMSMSGDDEFNGTILASNYRACGQWVSGEVSDWSNFSVDRCALSQPPTPTTTPIPVPAALPMFIAGLGLMGYVGRRRRIAG